jgi:PadR family transcriptional regulator, regulatory protein PadR
MPHSSRSDLLPGTLDMLVLRTLSLAPLHGYAIAQHIARLSVDVLKVEQGSLYPALERLLAAGWVTAKWGVSPTGRKARYYTITASGRKQLGQEISEFDKLTQAIARVLGREVEA